MQRRTVLTLAGAGAVSLAGCTAVSEMGSPPAGKYILDQSPAVAREPPDEMFSDVDSLSEQDRSLMQDTIAAAQKARSGEFPGLERVDVMTSSVFATTADTRVHVRTDGSIHIFPVDSTNEETTVSISYRGTWAENEGHYRFETLTDREQQVFDHVLNSDSKSFEGPNPEELDHLRSGGDAISEGYGVFYILKTGVIYRLNVSRT